tara:strand:- start:76 stop:693 length:618 start_codon:yes stop_codon:yes gene_type:complete
MKHAAIVLLLAATAEALLLGTPARAISRRCRLVSASTAPLLDAVFEAGPVGIDASEEQQSSIESLASALAGTAEDAAQARVPLKGTYDLMYSMAKGGSNGKVGPLTGKVSQIVVDEKNFINQVSLFGGAVVVQLNAQREVIDDNKIKVEFVETVFKIFGKEVKRQPTKGKGVWEQVYVERGQDGSAALRVMRTPSLFILRQRSEQ